MFEVAESCVNANVLVGFVIAISVSNNGQIWRVGNPQVVTVPRDSLHAVETFSERLAALCFSVPVVINQDVDTISRRFRRRTAPLRTLTNAKASVSVKSHHTWIANHWLLSNHVDHKTIRHDGQLVVSRQLDVCRKNHGQKNETHSHHWFLLSLATDMPSINCGCTDTVTDGASGCPSRHINCSTACRPICSAQMSIVVTSGYSPVSSGNSLLHEIRLTSRPICNPRFEKAR